MNGARDFSRSENAIGFCLRWYTPSGMRSGDQEWSRTAIAPGGTVPARVRGLNQSIPIARDKLDTAEIERIRVHNVDLETFSLQCLWYVISHALP